MARNCKTINFRIDANSTENGSMNCVCLCVSERMRQESNQAHKRFPIAMASARTIAYISIIILKQSYKIENNNASQCSNKMHGAERDGWQIETEFCARAQTRQMMMTTLAFDWNSTLKRTIVQYWGGYRELNKNKSELNIYIKVDCIAEWINEGQCTLTQFICNSNWFTHSENYKKNWRNLRMKTTNKIKWR